MKRNNAPFLWTVISLVVFCILVVGATYFAVETKSKDAILTETAKAFIQLGTVGVLGALVKFTFDQISEVRRKQQVDLEAKRELLEQLRKLKHVVRTAPFRIEEERSLEAYRQEMKALLNAYMEIGDFGNDTRLSEFIYPYNERVGIHVWMMSIFVSKILNEAVNQKIETWEQIVELPVFKHYRKAALDFLGTEDKYTPYEVDYNEHYNAIKKELKLLIIGERSSRWRETKGVILYLDQEDYKTSAGVMCQLKLKYRYFINGRKFEVSTNFKSFDQGIVSSALNSFSKVEGELAIFYDPANPGVSVVKLPSERAG